jgi:hypothetical protein
MTLSKTSWDRKTIFAPENSNGESLLLKNKI